MRKWREGFTIIEILVSVSIISLFASIVYASLGDTREKARIAAAAQFDATLYHAFGDQLEAFWNFTGDFTLNSMTVPDDSGNGHTMTLTNATWDPSSFSIHGGGSAVLSGTGSYGSFSNGIDVTKGIALSLWAKPTLGTLGAFIQIIWGNSLFRFIFSTPVPYRADAWIRDNGGQFMAALGMPLKLNKWNHLTYIFDPSNKKISIYVDGRFKASYENPNFDLGNFVLPLLSELFRTQGIDNSNFYGSVDQVKIYTGVPADL